MGASILVIVFLIVKWIGSSGTKVEKEEWFNGYNYLFKLNKCKYS
jgi:hypothetical protein